MLMLPPEVMSPVILRKMHAAVNPVCPTPSTLTFIPGIQNANVSLPVKYEIEGLLHSSVELGKPVEILRYRRNEVYALGVCETSSLTKIEKREDSWLLHTLNSVYELRKSDLKVK